ncbi:cerebellar degeneration-related protein 2 isoform 1-T1 [Hipposideros larvatus]
MLAENLVEEDFEIKEEEEPWFDNRELQQDLQLAAELGKTLLDRNTQLEESLQQMYTTNQEQLQEIEHLSKQVELLRQVNEQHAKVYEQLDVTARELEETNQKLVADSKASQQKILSLTETIECLQARIDHLQSQVDELRSVQQRRSQGKSDQDRPAPSCSRRKELYDLRQLFVYDHVFAGKITSLPSQQSPEEEENAHLKRTVATLQAQLGLERQKRATLEEEYGLVLAENSELEQQLGAAGAYRARALELEAEVADMRLALRAERPPLSALERLVPDALFVPFREPSASLLEEMLLTGAEAPPRPLRRSSSDTALERGAAVGDLAQGHEETCARRAQAGRRRGVCPLHEVDTQYSALREKYDQLLRKCQPPAGDARSHKAVQTSRAAASAAVPGPAEPAGSPASAPPPPPPEYKALFKEIFSCIEKSKQEIDAQRTKYRSAPSHS